MEPSDEPRFREPFTATPQGEAEIVTRKIGPGAYSLAIRAEGGVFMLAVDYYTDEEDVEAAILWLKRAMPGAAVRWSEPTP